MVSETTGSAEMISEQSASNLLSEMKIASISDDIVSVKNTGKTSLTNFEVYVNNIVVSSSADPPSITPGSITNITLSSTPDPGDVIKVTSAQGAFAIKAVPGEGVCMTDGCNGICPENCYTPFDDPDCGCVNDDGICCSHSCNSGNDNDCISCTADGDPCLTGSQCCNGVCVSGICGPCISGTNCGSPCSSGAYNFNDGTHTCEGSTNNACNVLLGEGQGDCDCDENCQAGMYCEELGAVDRCCPVGTNWDGASCVGGGGLVAYWKFDEGSGTTASDSSGNGNTGTLINMEAGDWRTGSECVSGGCLQFDGAGEYVNITQRSNLNLATFTAGLWLKPSQLSDNAGLFINSRLTAQYCGWSLTMDRLSGACGDGDICLFVSQSCGSANNEYIDYTYDFPVGSWSHWVVTFDNSTRNVSFFINGIYVFSEISTYYLGGFDGATTSIGGTQLSGMDFNGAIDEVKIWNRVLTAAEILNEYTSQAALFSDGFESGNFNLWNGGASYGGSGLAPVVQSSAAHNGLYAAKFAIGTAAGNGYSILVDAVSSTSTTMHIRAYCGFNATSIASGNYIYLGPTICDNTNSNDEAALIYNNGGKIVWGMRYRNNTGYQGAINTTSSIIPTANTWYSIEVMTTIGSGTGEVAMWINGISVIHVTGITNTIIPNLQNYQLGPYSSGTLTAPIAIYCDDAVMSTSYIGP